MNKPRPSIIGQTFGRLAVTHILDPHRSPSGQNHTRVWAICACGRGKSFLLQALRRGATKSCGCLPRGPRRGWRTKKASAPKAYRAWCGIKSRCLNPNHPGFHRYGGRGISICDRWRHSFDAFLEDVGQPPPGTSIDRIDNNGNYEPGNCRWASAAQQANNTRRNILVNHRGETKNISQWARSVGIAPITLRNRLLIYGWSVDRALSEPTRNVVRRRHKKRTNNNQGEARQ